MGRVKRREALLMCWHAGVALRACDPLTARRYDKMIHVERKMVLSKGFAAAPKRARRANLGAHAHASWLGAAEPFKIGNCLVSHDV